MPTPALHTHTHTFPPLLACIVDRKDSSRVYALPVLCLFQDLENTLKTSQTLDLFETNNRCLFSVYFNANAAISSNNELIVLSPFNVFICCLQLFYQRDKATCSQEALH